MADVANSKLFQTIEGIQHLKDVLVVLVKTEWNAAVVDELEAGCRRVFAHYNISTRTLVVPGAVEIPFAIRQCWTHDNSASAFIALGCVVRGGTPHFDYVAGECTKGLAQVSLNAGVPITFGVLTVDSIEQAIERSGTKAGNKGVEAAATALEMVSLLGRI